MSDCGGRLWKLLAPNLVCAPIVGLSLVVLSQGLALTLQVTEDG